MNRDNPLTCSERQQKTAFWIRGCLLVGLIGLLMTAGLFADLCLMHRRPCLNVSPERINPNTASMASLVRLPGIGRGRAVDVIHYRENQGQNGPVFGSLQDLEAIRGIGPKTAAKLAPWLVFEGD